MAVRVLLDHGVPGEYPSSSGRSLDSAAHGGAQRDRVAVRVCVRVTRTRATAGGPAIWEPDLCPGLLVVRRPGGAV